MTPKEGDPGSKHEGEGRKDSDFVAMQLEEKAPGSMSMMKSKPARRQTMAAALQAKIAKSLETAPEEAGAELTRSKSIARKLTASLAGLEGALFGKAAVEAAAADAEAAVAAAAAPATPEEPLIDYASADAPLPKHRPTTLPPLSSRVSTDSTLRDERKVEALRKQSMSAHAKQIKLEQKQRAAAERAAARTGSLLFAFSSKPPPPKPEQTAVEYQRTIKELLAMEGDAGAIECNRRGLEANAHGDVATALRLFLRARELRPEQPNYALSAANMHIKRGDPRAAISLFDEVLAEPDKLTEKQLHVARSKMEEAKAMPKDFNEKVSRAAAGGAQWLRGFLGMGTPRGTTADAEAPTDAPPADAPPPTGEETKL